MVVCGAGYTRDGRHNGLVEVGLGVGPSLHALAAVGRSETVRWDGVVAWIATGDAPSHPSSSSGDADENRASQLRHAIQDVDGDTNFCASAFVLVEAQPIADYLLISTDRGLDTTSRRIA
jgi:hypothetical protein